MKRFDIYLFLLIFLLIVNQSFSATYCSNKVKVQNPAIPIDSLLKKHPLKISGHWFLGYQYSEEDGLSSNNFALKRGYITFKQQLSDRFLVRFTHDITLDEEGSDAGNIEMKLKYCYLKINLPDFAIFNKSFLEFGMVHRPWLDFEQHINFYRVQGKMYLERIKICNSADFGITFTGLLGGQVDKSFSKNISNYMPGKYGSISFGVYNGGGYTAIEQNKNKTFESRLTLRPLPEIMPGLQLTYTGAYGKGNTDLNPDFILHSGFVSYQNKFTSLSGQYYHGKGNSSGSYADTTGIAYDNFGYSLFGEIKFFANKMTLFGRYDYFELQGETNETLKRIIAGIGYYFYKSSKLILDIDYSGDDDVFENYVVEAAIEIKF